MMLLGFIYTNDGQEQFGCGVTDEDYVGFYYPEALDHPGRVLWANNCITCHDLDEVVIGPPLRGVFNRRDSVWITKAIIDFEALVNAEDSLAIAIFNEYNQTSHTRYTGFSEDDLALLLDYLYQEGERELN